MNFSTKFLPSSPTGTEEIRAIENELKSLAEIDYRFVTHPSVIYYKDARELDLKLVETAITSGIRKLWSSK